MISIRILQTEQDGNAHPSMVNDALSLPFQGCKPIERGAAVIFRVPTKPADALCNTLAEGVLRRTATKPEFSAA